MSYSAPARTTSRRIPTIVVAGPVVVIAAITYPLLASSSSTAASPIHVPRREQPGAIGEADGVVPDGTTIFDDEIPAVARYGPCQIYRNEPWHYELRPEAIDQGAPPMYADPTQDPRMRRDTRGAR